MLDRWLRPLIARPLDLLASLLAKTGLPPAALTWLGLGVGLSTLPLMAQHHYQAALACILLNRLLDGLDGALARRLQRTSPYGAWLDIVCDMLFYGAVVLGMALALPDHAFYSALLLFGFLGTSSSLLAAAALFKPTDERGLYFAPGLVEGSETLLFFVAFCLMPYIYPTLALVFATLCFVTVLIRMLSLSRKPPSPL
ncbi:MAG: hypothetical protein CVV27_00935 [Candidatus Melainabacteria bacterium HGW-Melainabacteria-1]|nr:MAG: hypothetical protein CVV27_00935 [Candidatus Melainabacteria bacterium HGW-Melainabacteria-1]